MEPRIYGPLSTPIDLGSLFFSDMEAECSDDVMKLHVKFNDTFAGLIYSAGKIQKMI